MLDDQPKKWVGGICIRDSKILLIYRINKEKDLHKEYFVFPGGTVEDDQTIEETLIKEFEDISISVTLGDLFYSKEGDEEEESEYYYMCTHVLGDPSSFKAKNKEDLDETKEKTQFYTPMWVAMSELEEMIVYPESMKAKLLQELGGKSRWK